MLHQISVNIKSLSLSHFTHVFFSFFFSFIAEATDDQPFVANNEKPTDYDPNLYLYSVKNFKNFVQHSSSFFSLLLVNVRAFTATGSFKLTKRMS